MIKQGFTGNQSSVRSGPVALTSRHLLGMEGVSPIEIGALLDRGHMFADNPHDSISDALRGKTIINLFYEILPARASLLSLQQNGLADRF